MENNPECAILRITGGNLEKSSEEIIEKFLEESQEKFGEIFGGVPGRISGQHIERIPENIIRRKSAEVTGRTSGEIS